MPRSLHNGLTAPDLLAFLLYLLGVSGYGHYLYKRRQRAQPESKDYFLAEGSLTWWAIGVSMITSNLSAEELIGMSGSGFSVAVAVAANE